MTIKLNGNGTIEGARLQPVGLMDIILSDVAPDGWILMAGNSIGNAASGATERANADTYDLFAHIWAKIPVAQLPIQTSAGVASTKGATALADFNANKRIVIPDVRGLVLRGVDLSRGFDPGRLLATYQEDAIRNLTGTVTMHGGGNATNVASLGGAFKVSGLQRSNYRSGGADLSGANSVDGFNLDASTQVPTAAENRVKSFSGLPIIKL